MMERGSKIIETSILMPVYNEVRNVGRAIESIPHQNYESWELIVLDDGSTDGREKLSTNTVDETKE